jgi:hypothetical protein
MFEVRASTPEKGYSVFTNKRNRFALRGWIGYGLGGFGGLGRFEPSNPPNPPDPQSIKGGNESPLILLSAIEIH